MSGVESFSSDSVVFLPAFGFAVLLSPLPVFQMGVSFVGCCFISVIVVCRVLHGVSVRFAWCVCFGFALGGNGGGTPNVQECPKRDNMWVTYVRLRQVSPMGGSFYIIYKLLLASRISKSRPFD